MLQKNFCKQEQEQMVSLLVNSDFFLILSDYIIVAMWIIGQQKKKLNLEKNN